VEAHGSPISGKVTIKVVAEESAELLTRGHVRAGRDHVTSGQGLIESRVIPTVQLVHDHFPDGMRAGGTVLCIPVTFMRHPEVEGVGPDRDTPEGGRD